MESLSRSRPRTFPTIIILHVALLTAVRPTSLPNMKITQFALSRDNGGKQIIFTSSIWCRDRSTKCRRIGIKAIGNMPKTIKIWRFMAFTNQVCVYDDLLEYSNLYNGLQPSFDWLFLQPNDIAKVNCICNFFTGQNVGQNSFINYIELSFKRTYPGSELEIISQCTSYGGQWFLRSTLRVLQNSLITMFNGHCESTTFERYGNLMG